MLSWSGRSGSILIIYSEYFAESCPGFEQGIYPAVVESLLEKKKKYCFFKALVLRSGVTTNGGSRVNHAQEVELDQMDDRSKLPCLVPRPRPPRPSTISHPCALAIPAK